MRGFKLVRLVDGVFKPITQTGVSSGISYTLGEKTFSPKRCGNMTVFQSKADVLLFLKTYSHTEDLFLADVEYEWEPGGWLQVGGLVTSSYDVPAGTNFASSVMLISCEQLDVEGISCVE